MPDHISPDSLDWKTTPEGEKEAVVTVNEKPIRILCYDGTNTAGHSFYSMERTENGQIIRCVTFGNSDAEFNNTLKEISVP